MSVLPQWVANKMEASWPRMRTYQTKPDGNCLFESIHMILKSVGIHRTVKELRQIAAAPVLDENDQITNKIIREWLEIAQSIFTTEDRDWQLVIEYKHLFNLAKSSWPLSRQQRLGLYNAMLDSSFWGEHHCLRVFEEQTQIRFLIIQDSTKAPILTWEHSTNFQQHSFSILFLRGQHYTPVSIDGRFVFAWNEIPVDVQKFFSTGYLKKK